MHTPQQSHSPQQYAALARKLRPNRFPRMSSVMAAIVGFVIGTRFTEPAISEIVVSSDGFVLARADGESGANHFIGTYSDLLRNWLGLIGVAGLTTRELIEAQALFAAEVGFFGRETA
jgi:hypothetical protein